MANEIKLTVQLQYTNGSAKDQFVPGTVNINQATQGLFGNIVTVGSTAEEDLSFPDIATEGIVVGQNLDAANYVRIGPSTGGAMYPFIRVKAGEPFAFRMDPTATWRWQANAADVKVQVKMYEE